MIYVYGERVKSDGNIGASIEMWWKNVEMEQIVTEIDENMEACNFLCPINW